MTTEEFKKNIVPFAKKLYPYINTILRDEEDSRDAVQELMLKLWSKRKELSKCRNQSAYITTMAKNYCFDHLKKKRPELISKNEENKLLNRHTDEINFEEKERYDQVHKIIENLPEKYKEIIRLRDVDGFTFEEIHEMTNLEIPNIRVILSRSRQMVKSELEKIYNYGQSQKFAQQIL